MTQRRALFLLSIVRGSHPHPVSNMSQPCGNRSLYELNTTAFLPHTHALLFSLCKKGLHEHAGFIS